MGTPSPPEPTSPFEKHLFASQAPLGAETSCIPSPRLSLERIEGTAGCVTALGGTSPA